MSLNSNALAVAARNEDPSDRLDGFAYYTPANINAAVAQPAPKETPFAALDQLYAYYSA